MFKNLILSALILVILGYLSACCKGRCADEPGIIAIKFIDFTESQLDTVIIESFQKNSNFKTRVDSSARKASPGVNFIPLDAKQDWKISVENNAYLIKDITLQTERCTICSGNPDYKKVKSFLLNNQSQSGNEVELGKP